MVIVIGLVALGSCLIFLGIILNKVIYRGYKRCLCQCHYALIGARKRKVRTGLFSGPPLAQICFCPSKFFFFLIKLYCLSFLLVPTALPYLISPVVNLGVASGRCSVTGYHITGQDQLKA